MKKHYTLFIIALAGLLQLNAQTKGDKGELYASIDNGLLFTSKDLKMHDENFYIPYLTLGVEFRMIKELTGYLEVQIPLLYPSGLQRNINAFGEFDQGSNLSLLREWRGDSRMAASRFNLGVGYRLYVKKWRFVPQMGMGWVAFDYSESSYLLKELGTSNMYDINYRIGGSGSDYSSALTYLQFRLKAQTKINRRLSLNLGVSYSLYVSRIELRGEYKDYYDRESDYIYGYGNYSEPLKEISIAKFPHELSFSVGVGFR